MILSDSISKRLNDSLSQLTKKDVERAAFWGIVALVVMFLISAFLVMILWNSTLPYLFKTYAGKRDPPLEGSDPTKFTNSIEKITFVEALLLRLLVLFLFF